MKLALFLLIFRSMNSQKFSEYGNNKIQATCGLTSENKVLNGVRVRDMKEAPTVVGIAVGGDTDIYWCTGTRISPRHILTAAHCLRPIITSEDCSIGKVQVNFSAILIITKTRCLFDGCVFNRKNTTEYRTVIWATNISKFICQNDREQDLVILTLDKDMQYSSISTHACLTDRRLPIGTTTRFFGYGYDNRHTSVEPRTELLKWYDTQVHQCDDNNTDPGLICFKNYELKSTCRGDSGGGYLYNNNGRITLSAVHSGKAVLCSKIVAHADEHRKNPISTYAVEVFHHLDFICEETGVCVKRKE